MTMMAIAGVSLLAGWAVNLAADTLPNRTQPNATLAGDTLAGDTLSTGETSGHAWSAVWAWPVRQFFTPPGHATPLAQRRGRAGLVWVAALILGFVALGRAGFSPFGLLAALYGWFFLAVAVIDLEHRRVLNVMLLALAPVALAASLLLQTPTWTSALAGGLLGFVLFLVIAIIRPGGMGMGDVKLAGAIGLVTGLSGVVTALTIGIFAGGIAALGLLVRSRLTGGVKGQFDRQLSMAYAPYLVLGAWVALYAGW